MCNLSQGIEEKGLRLGVQKVKQYEMVGIMPLNQIDLGAFFCSFSFRKIYPKKVNYGTIINRNYNVFCGR